MLPADTENMQIHPFFYASHASEQLRYIDNRHQHLVYQLYIIIHKCANYCIVFLKKTAHLIFGHNFCGRRPIFKILSLTDSKENLCTFDKRLSPYLNCAPILPCTRIAANDDGARDAV